MAWGSLEGFVTATGTGGNQTATFSNTSDDSVLLALVRVADGNVGQQPRCGGISGGSLTWTKLAAQTFDIGPNTDGAEITVWYAVAATHLTSQGISTSITNLVGTTAARICVVGVPEADTSAIFDGNASLPSATEASGSVTSLSNGSAISTDGADTMLFGFVGGETGWTGMTPPSGWSAMGSSGSVNEIDDRFVTSQQSSQTYGWSWTNASHAALIVGGVLKASSGVSGTVSVTEGGDTFAASGEVQSPISGTLDVTEGGDAFAGAGTVTTALSGTMDVTEGGDTFAGAGAAGTTPVIDDDFERSSVNVAGSSVTGSGDSAIVSIKPRVQESEVAVAGSLHTRWLFPLARVTGVLGSRPTFKFLDYAATAADGTYHGAPWQSGRRPMFSYDFVTWTHFDTNVTLNASDIEFRHSTTFTQNAVYISWGRVHTVAMMGAWIDDLAAAHPGIVRHVPSNTTDFVSGTFSAQTDELGRAIPAQPFHGFKIADDSLDPPSGLAKGAMVLGCGTHAGEDQGDWVMKAAVEFVLSADAKAQKVRQHFDIFVYGLVNAPGRTGGGWRGSFAQGTGGADDANRHFSDPDVGGDGGGAGLEIVNVPKAAFLLDLPAIVQIAFLYHGQYADQYGIIVDSGNANDATLLTALQVYTPTATDVGDPSAGAEFIWFKNVKGATFAQNIETGEPSPLTDADIAAWGETTMKAVSDLIDAAEIVFPTAAVGSLSPFTSGGGLYVGRGKSPPFFVRRAT